MLRFLGALSLFDVEGARIERMNYAECWLYLKSLKVLR
ncbi:unnamed protein product [Brugia timori]|uniref:Bm14234 n=2 Tax=Brugia TaxID=6278 RepID=A0A1U7F1F1_BRUMA|nr:Bm14234 [Brugia malayi]VDO38217.1 unnamed protein product [Brugia timori]